MEYIDFIPQDVLDRLAEAERLVNNVKKAILGLAEAESKRSAASSATTTSSKPDPGQQEALRLARELEKAEAKLTDEYRKQAQSLANIRAITNAESKKRRLAAEAARLEAGSIAALRIEMRQLKAAIDAMNPSNAAELAALEKKKARYMELHAVVTKHEQSMGNFSRNVGNYASGFSALGFSIQQIARELPSIAHSLPQFFLAISNNIPMFTDQLNNARRDYKKFIEEVAKGNTNVEKVEKPFKQVLRSIISWQTAMVVVLTLLVSHGDKVVAWARALFNAGKQIDIIAESQKEFNSVMREGQKSAEGEIVKLELLYKAAIDVGKSIDERRKATDELQRIYPDYLGNISDEAILAGNAAGAYDKLKSAILAKAQAQAAADRIAENNLKILENEEKIASNEQTVMAIDATQQLINKNASGLSKVIGDFAAELGNPEIQRMFYEGPTAFGHSLDEKREKAISDTNKLTIENEKLATSNKKLADSIDIEALIGGGSRTQKSQSGLKDRLKQFKDEAKAYEELTAEEYRMRKWTNEQIINDDRFSIEDRQAASDEYYKIERERTVALSELQIKNIRAVRAEELAVAKKQDIAKSTGVDINKVILTAEQIKEIEVQAATDTAIEVKAIQTAATNDLAIQREEAAKKRQAFEDEAVSNAIRNVEREMKARQTIIDETESNELAALSNTYMEGLMSQEKYEKQRLAITRKYAIERQEAEINALQKQLEKMRNHSDLDEQEKQRIIELEAELTKLRVELAEYTNDAIISDNEDFYNELSEKIKRYGAFVTETFNLMADAVSIGVEKELAEIDKLEKAAEKAAEDEQDRIERLAEAGAISEEQKNARIALSEQQLAAQQELFERRRVDARRRQAKFEKAAALVQATIYGAAAVVEALPNIVLAIITGALAAAQIGIIAAQPLPQYAKGTDYHPGGLALVGDGGRPELITYGGKGYKTPAVPTLINLPKGAEVLPDYNIAIRDMLLSSAITNSVTPEVQTFSDKNLLAQISQTNARLEKLGKINEMHLSEYRREKANRRFDEFRRRRINNKIN